MPDQEFQIEITDQLVFVRLDVSTRSGKTRFKALACYACITVLLMSAVTFFPGKHNSPSDCQALSTSPVCSSEFLIPLFLLLSFPVAIFLGTKRYVMLAYPSDETFRCDRSTLTLSKVRWLDTHNCHWDTCSFPLAEVQEIRFQAIASLRGGSIYGISFLAGGKKRRVLPGIKPRDAEKILNALKTFGTHVLDDPALQRKLKEDKVDYWNK